MKAAFVKDSKVVVEDIKKPKLGKGEIMDSVFKQIIELSVILQVSFLASLYSLRFFGFLAKATRILVA